MKFSKIYFVIPILLLVQYCSGQNETSEYLNLESVELGELESLEGINSRLIEFAPTLYGDELFYISSNTGKKRFRQKDELTYNLMHASINQNGTVEAGKDFELLKVDEGFEGPCSFSSDGKWLFITRNQHAHLETDDGIEMRLGIYLYQKEDSLWRFKGQFPVNNPAYNVCHPSYDEKGGRLIFASDMPGGFGKLDLYSIKFEENGKWGKAINLGVSINSEKNDCFPFAAEHHFLIFSSDRKGTKGGLDIYCSAFEENTWMEIAKFPDNVNSAYDDLSMIVTNDGHNLYFASSRPGGQGMDDIYSLSLSSSLYKKYPGIQNIKVVHAGTQKPVIGAELSFFKFNTEEAKLIKDDNEFKALNFIIDPESIKGSKPIFANNSGEINISLEMGEYILQVKKDNYRDNQKLIRIEQSSGDYLVFLDSIVCKKLQLNIVDGKSKTLIRDVVFSSEFADEKISSDIGQLDLCVPRDKNVSGIVQAEAYKDKTLSYSFDEVADSEQKIIELFPEEVFVDAFPMQKGEIRIMGDILYEFDRSDLNKEARSELNLLADHLKENPELVIELRAHTDSRGSSVYNQLLSEKRAKIAREYLLEKGIDDRRIAAIGFGESRLLNDCSDEQNCGEEKHAENRRTEVKVVANQFEVKD